MCRLGAHTFSHYTFLNTPNMVLSCHKKPESYITSKLESRGGVNFGRDLGMTFFQSFICVPQVPNVSVKLLRQKYDRFYVLLREQIKMIYKK